MNHLIQFKTPTSRVLLTLTLFCCALLPKVRAVVPAPDGGYPGGNTAEGQNALFSLTTGGFNTAVGFLSLRSDTTAGFNTAIGAGTLAANTAARNTATGAGALLSNTTAPGNTADGAFALLSNTTGADNTAVGAGALFMNTAGSYNTAVGVDALHITSGDGNTACGWGALFNINTGTFNTALGVDAGSNLTTGSNNIHIANLGLAGDSSTTRIGSIQTKTFIAGIRGVTTVNPDAIPVLIDSADQLGTMSSSRRFKKQIKPMDKASEAILALKPVTFRYKSDKTNRPEFGLVAEDVAEVNPALVVCDEKGEIYTVRYDAVNAMLLNEFLKEHRKVEKLEATVADLIATVKQQAAQIQKVNAQIETRKAAPQMVLNDQ
jgi:Chaperone of endosialidase